VFIIFFIKKGLVYELLINEYIIMMGAAQVGGILEVSLDHPYPPPPNLGYGRKSTTTARSKQ